MSFFFTLVRVIVSTLTALRAIAAILIVGQGIHAWQRNLSR